jgi:hypothetical protein
MKSSHSFEVFTFGRTWMKGRVEEEELLYAADVSTDYLCSAPVISAQNKSQTSLHQSLFKSLIGK